MIAKNNTAKIEKELKNKKIKLIAMLAPSFAAEFDYPSIINQLRALGFDKIVELTFGAKLVNHEYHKIIENPENNNKLFIASVCPGIVEFIREKYPQNVKNLMPVVSPMIATAMVCRKIYSKHKIVFISPCEFKKLEARDSKFVDYTIDYRQLNCLFVKNNIQKDKTKAEFDKFYNDYTKIYPLSGGLSETAHVKGILHRKYSKVIDGIQELDKFLKNPKKDIRFIDTCFCVGACIGGPYLSNKNLKKKRKRVLDYLNIAKCEKIPKQKKGILKKAGGINLKREY